MRRRFPGTPAMIWDDDVPLTNPPRATTLPLGSATAESREVATGRDPTRAIVSAGTLVRVWVTCEPARRLTNAACKAVLAGRKSIPSGLSRYPGAADATSVCPYCHTIRFVRGSITTTR